MTAPHIYIQLEDTMFVDSTRLVTLECVYYAKDCDSDKNIFTHLSLKDNQSNLLTTNIANDKKDKVYGHKPLCYQESENYLLNNKNLLEASTSSMVEVLISFWDVNING